MFNRKKHLIKPPKFDTHRIFNLMLEERGLHVLNNDMITLTQDTCKRVELTYLEYYVCPINYLN
jgi:hypothetical protein